MNKKNNPISLIKKHPNFEKISKEIDAQVRLAVEVFDARKAKKMSQQELAIKVGTTQKIISKIESGDINIGLNLLQRLARSLELNLQFGNIFLVKNVKVQDSGQRTGGKNYKSAIEMPIDVKVSC